MAPSDGGGSDVGGGKKGRFTGCPCVGRESKRNERVVEQTPLEESMGGGGREMPPPLSFQGSQASEIFAIEEMPPGAKHRAPSIAPAPFSPPPPKALLPLFPTKVN